jgi:hypothetical protein
MEPGTAGQAERTILSPMGRANQRPRKGTAKHEHLAKVGSAPDLRTEGQRERGAVMDVMGLGNLGSTGKSVLFGIGALILIAAIVALIVLTVA